MINNITSLRFKFIICGRSLAIFRLLVCDVDGTLTDGTIIHGTNDFEFKAFSAKDGLILKVLPKMGLPVLLLTGRTSQAVKKRAVELECLLLDNVQDKFDTLKKYLHENAISIENAVYIGDDMNDYAAMKMCGYKACPSDAVNTIRDICDYISPLNGGHGAVRDICEHILKMMEKYEKLLEMFEN